MSSDTAAATPRDSTVLVAAADDALRAGLARALSGEFQVIAVPSAHAGEQELAAGGVAAVVCSTTLQDMPGLAWLGQLRRRRDLPAIRLFAPEVSSEALAVEAVNVAGVFRYLADPTDQDALRRAVREAIELVGHRSGPPCMREAVGQAIKAHTPCRGSARGCLLETARQAVEPPATLLRRMSSVAGWTGMGMMGVSLLLLAGLLMGIGVFTVLYVFKSALGIDLIDGWHFTDWLHR